MHVFTCRSVTFQIRLIPSASVCAFAAEIAPFLDLAGVAFGVDSGSFLLVPHVFEMTGDSRE